MCTKKISNQSYQLRIFIGKNSTFFKIKQPPEYLSYNISYNGLLTFDSRDRCLDNKFRSIQKILEKQNKKHNPPQKTKTKQKRQIFKLKKNPKGGGRLVARHNVLITSYIYISTVSVCIIIKPISKLCHKS